MSHPHSPLTETAPGAGGAGRVESGHDAFCACDKPCQQRGGRHCLHAQQARRRQVRYEAQLGTIV